MATNKSSNCAEQEKPQSRIHLHLLADVQIMNAMTSCLEIACCDGLEFTGLVMNLNPFCLNMVQIATHRRRGQRQHARHARSMLP